MTQLSKTDYLGGLVRTYQKEGQLKQYRLFWKWWVNNVEEK